jgi:hypothetical protein
MYLGAVRSDFTIQVLPGPVVAPEDWDAAKLGKPFPDEAALLAATGGATAQESDALAVAWAEAQTRKTRYSFITDQSWPILAAHPATNDIPANGMCYRLSEGGSTTWWVLRQGDLIATQISAHNAAGEQIVRSINLRTGAETEINLDRIANANNFGQLRAAKVKRTNVVGRTRQ